MSAAGAWPPRAGAAARPPYRYCNGNSDGDEAHGWPSQMIDHGNMLNNNASLLDILEVAI